MDESITVGWSAELISTIVRRRRARFCRSRSLVPLISP
jgi:hypothetical protein